MSKKRNKNKVSAGKHLGQETPTELTSETSKCSHWSWCVSQTARLSSGSFCSTAKVLTVNPVTTHCSRWGTIFSISRFTGGGTQRAGAGPPQVSPANHFASLGLVIKPGPGLMFYLFLGLPEKHCFPETLIPARSSLHTKPKICF